MRDPVRMIVALSVDLDRQPRFGAVEVENIGTDRVLSSELQAAELPPSQPDP